MESFQIKSKPLGLQMSKLSEAQTGLAEDHTATSLGSVSPGNLWFGVKWPHKVQTSDLSPGKLVCNTSLLAKHRRKASS